MLLLLLLLLLLSISHLHPTAYLTTFLLHAISSLLPPVLSDDCSKKRTNIHNSELSSQLVELESRLKAESESRYLRAIVFVNTKIAAIELVKRLKSQFPGLHPEYITGHSLGIGTTMSEQRKMIDKFKTG